MAEFLAQNRFLIPRATYTAALSSTKIHQWTRHYKHIKQSQNCHKATRPGGEPEAPCSLFSAGRKIPVEQCCAANSTPAARRKSLNILALNGFLQVKPYQTPADVFSKFATHDSPERILTSETALPKPCRFFSKFSTFFGFLFNFF